VEASAHAQLGARVDNQTAELGSRALTDHELTLCYGNNNPDLQRKYCSARLYGVRRSFCFEEQHFRNLDSHWRRSGKKEWEKTKTKEKGKFCPDFSLEQKEALCYGNRYSDLQSKFCKEMTCWSYWHTVGLTEHYKRHGRESGMEWGCAPSQEALCYGNRYADLQKEFCGGQECSSFVHGEKLAAHYHQLGVSHRR
jgi:hypothetical protein